MSFDLNSIAGITAALGAGYITERYARELLIDMGFEDDVITSLLSVGAGMVVGATVGSVVEDIFDGLF